MTVESVTSAHEPALPAANASITMPRFELGERFTAEQREFLDTYGFIRFRNFVSKSEVLKLVEDVEAVDRQFIAEGRTHVFGVPLIIGKRPDGTKFVQRMCFASLFGAKLAGFLRDPRFNAILDVAGHDYRIAERERDGLVVNHYRREEGSVYKQLGWHTDSLRDVFYLEKPRRYLNVGFYLDDSPITKGGVRLLPRTQDQNIWSMLTRKVHFITKDPDPDEYGIVADAGDLTIHDGRIWHRVATASVTGDASQRRVMYLPLMNGPLKIKNDASPTPAYFKLKRFVG